MSCGSRRYLREGVGSVGRRGGEGGEEGGSTRRFDRVDHALQWQGQVRGLPEGADEHKHVVHAWGRRGRGREHDAERFISSSFRQLENLYAAFRELTFVGKRERETSSVTHRYR